MAEEMDFMMDDDDGILDYDDGDDLDFSTDNEEEDEESIIVWVNYNNRFVLKYEFFQSGFNLLVFYSNFGLTRLSNRCHEVPTPTFPPAAEPKDFPASYYFNIIIIMFVCFFSWSSCT